jgi:hypothetical protein
MWKHVLPLNDVMAHNCPIDEDMEFFDCPCNPMIDYDKKLVVHNSISGRETNDRFNAQSMSGGVLSVNG